MNSSKTIGTILGDLSSVRENLLSLSDDIWLSIDHNNTEKMKEGVQFKTEFNTLFGQFEQTSQALAALIRQFTGVPDTEAAKTVAPAESPENKRLIAALDKEKPHQLDEKFTYKRPFAFVLQGQAFGGTETWRAVYLQVCACLLSRDRKRFQQVLTDETFISPRGRKYFSENGKELRDASRITDNLYAETNLSAVNIIDEIKDLFAYFGIPQKDMILYLREDRNA